MGLETVSHVTYATRSSVVAVGVTLPLLAILAVGLRFYTRHAQKTSLWVDDWLTLPALALNIGTGIAMIIGARTGGLGYMTPFPKTLDPGVVVKWTSAVYTLVQKIEVAVQLQQLVALGFTKLSVLFFYRRIFCTGKSGLFSHITYTMIGLTIAWSISLFLALLFKCGTSFYAQWGSIQDLETKCRHVFAIEDGLVISDFLFDLLILLLPIPMIWGLQMSWVRRISIIGVFLTGTLALLASALRMAVTTHVDHIGFNRRVDPTVEIAEMLYWSIIESGLALIAACLPSFNFWLRDLSFKKMFRGFRNIFTPRSRRPQQSERALRPQQKATDDRYDTSVFPQTSFDNSTGRGSTQIYAMNDLESQKYLSEHAEPPAGAIMVRNHVVQSTMPPGNT